MRPPAARRLLLALLALVPAAGCREADRPFAPGPAVGVIVGSDPAGAEILIDGQSTGQRTPGRVDVSPGQHRISARLDSAGVSYSYAADVTLTGADSVVTVFGPLMLPCCLPAAGSAHESAGLRLSTNAGGALLYEEGRGNGWIWPLEEGNSYVSVGQPVFAGIVEAGELRVRVSLGPYDAAYMIGRPAPSVERGPAFRLRQSFWVVPPADLRRFHTVRGIEVGEEIVARDDVDGVVLVRLTFRNITGDSAYRAVDGSVPVGGLTYRDAWIGFALDGDVGTGQQGTDDDMLSYAPDLGLAFIYDYDFREASYRGGWAERPGLIGLRLVEWPAGSTLVLNGWPGRTARGAIDWMAGTASEVEGHDWLSGKQDDFADEPDPAPDLRIGHAPEAAADMRVLASAGPLTLAPGDSARIVVAVVVAPPEPGTFTPGTALPPGNRFDDTGRPILGTAAALLARARAAAALAGAR